MVGILALVLAAHSGGPSQLPPAPVKVWHVAWHRQRVPPSLREGQASELGGPAVDPVTGYVVVGTRDGWLRALDPDGTLVWSMKAAARFDAAPRGDRDTVYAGSNDGCLYAIDVASGKLRWKYEARE